MICYKHLFKVTETEFVSVHIDIQLLWTYMYKKLKLLKHGKPRKHENFRLYSIASQLRRTNSSTNPLNLPFWDTFIGSSFNITRLKKRRETKRSASDLPTAPITKTDC